MNKKLVSKILQEFLQINKKNQLKMSKMHEQAFSQKRKYKWQKNAYMKACSSSLIILTIKIKNWLNG